MPDDFGAQIHGLQRDLNSLERRVSKTEKWCEEESPEFHRRVERFVTRYEAIESERTLRDAQRHRENVERMEQIRLRNERTQQRNDRWNIIIAALGLICALCMLYLAARASNHATANPLHVGQHSDPQMAQQESAHIPIL